MTEGVRVRHGGADSEVDVAVAQCMAALVLELCKDCWEMLKYSISWMYDMVWTLESPGSVNSSTRSRRRHGLLDVI